LVLDGSKEAEDRARAMLFYDVTNGLTRRARAGNVNAIKTIQRLQDQFRIDQTGGFFPFIPSI
jgi:urocanate hydratase